MSRRWCLPVAALLWAASVSAEPITLEQALARAAEVSTAIQLQELSSEAAEAGWLADPEAGTPSLRLGVRDLEVPTAANPVPGDPEFVARLRMPLPRPWDLDAAAKLGRATVAREDAQLEGVRADLRDAVTRRFHALPLLRDEVAQAAELARLRDAHTEAVAERRSEGLATALDWLASEEDRRDADDRRANRLADLQGLEAELRLLLQWPVDEPLELVAVDQSPRVLAPTPTLAELVASAEARDPGVREADAEIARAEARLHRLQLRSLPWLDWAQGGAILKANRPTAFEVGVAVDIPVYMWGATRTRAASQEVASAKLTARDARTAAEQRLARRLRSVAAARERWEVERTHRDAVRGTAEPLIELADPLVAIELRARLLQAELRVLSAYAALVEELDRLDAEAAR